MQKYPNNERTFTLDTTFDTQPPLAGIRVIDFGHYIAGPLTGISACRARTKGGYTTTGHFVHYDHSAS
ncbi:hypothetical protein IH992_14115 [Candidatus Poribacteria bacterium]|nr:hypothetical protein [Candidatus Poribacteria bacterium]